MKDNLLISETFNTICKIHGNKVMAALYQHSKGGVWYIFITEMDAENHIVTNKVLQVYTNTDFGITDLIQCLVTKYSDADVSLHYNEYCKDNTNLLTLINKYYNPIKDLREITDLSQQAFAEKYGIPFNTIRNWESAIGSSRHRDCPEYVFRLLTFRVFHDYKIGRLDYTMPEGWSNMPFEETEFSYIYNRNDLSDDKVQSFVDAQIHDGNNSSIISCPRKLADNLMIY